MCNTGFQGRMIADWARTWRGAEARPRPISGSPIERHANQSQTSNSSGCVIWGNRMNVEIPVNRA